MKEYAFDEKQWARIMAVHDAIANKISEANEELEKAEKNLINYENEHGSRNTFEWKELHELKRDAQKNYQYRQGQLEGFEAFLRAVKGYEYDLGERLPKLTAKEAKDEEELYGPWSVSYNTGIN